MTTLNGKAYRALVAEDLAVLLLRMPQCPERDHIACILRRELTPPALRPPGQTGRPRKDIDIRPAMEMIASGHGLKRIAQALGTDRNTLRRRLVEAGVWPLGEAP